MAAYDQMGGNAANRKISARHPDHREKRSPAHSRVTAVQPVNTRYQYSQVSDAVVKNVTMAAPRSA